MSDEARTLLVDNIGSLVTNDPALGAGPLGIVTDAAVVVQGEQIVWVGPRSALDGAGADERVDAAGRAVIPVPPEQVAVGRDADAPGSFRTGSWLVESMTIAGE